MTRRPPEDRYRRGQRRTHAEPLTASWRLDTSTFRLETEESAPEESEPGRSAPDESAPGQSGSGQSGTGKSGSAEKRWQAKSSRHRSGRGGYGWRVYALPVLVVVTILVVVNTAQRGNGNSSAAGVSAAHGQPDQVLPSTPVATEQAVVPVDPGKGTAALPAGAAVPQAGAGTWHVVPGNGPIVGRGKHLYHYQVAVEDGIDPAVYGGDDAFAQDVQATLADPRSWIAGGTLSLQRVDGGFAHPDFVVSLTTPNTDHRPDLCGYDVHFETSCWRAGANRVVVNLARWVRGALAFNGDLGLYRQYAVNHEVGHVFGNSHVGCTTNGGLAPVMMQQTLGVSDDYVYDLNQVDPGNRAAVPRDGKVCRPNAWPYPQGSGG